MAHTGWYLVGYDVAQPRRLKKIHRLLSAEGLAAQNSLFFVQGRERELNALLDRLATVIDPATDDLRAYPLTNPGAVWSSGRRLPSLPLIHPTATEEQPAAGNDNHQGWLRRLLGKRR